MQSAVPVFDGFKLGDEVKAGAHDVRSDNIKATKPAAGVTAGNPQEHQAVQSTVSEMEGRR